MKKHVKLIILKYPKLAKCECCDRVKDIFYTANIMDFDDEDLIVGNINFCKQCGDNFNKILGNELNIGEKIIKEFKF